MPGLLIPHKSGVHRVACFALYRALLRQKSKLPVPEQQRHQYEAQIKLKTRENSRLQGHGDIAIALRLGYETLEALEDGSRREIILSRITQLSTSIPKTLAKDGKKSTLKPPKPKTAPRVTAFQERCRPLSHRSPVLDRPYLQISGRRHIPKLVDANRFPFLRIKKPQPPLIGFLIRRASALREKRILKRLELEKNVSLGTEEDDWDRILERDFGLSEPAPSWKDASVQALQDIKRYYEAAIRKRRTIAKQMTIIVEKEKALASQEEAQLQKRKRWSKTNVSTSDDRTEENPAGSKQSSVTSLGSELLSTTEELQAGKTCQSKDHEHRRMASTKSGFTLDDQGDDISNPVEKSSATLAHVKIDPKNSAAVGLEPTLHKGHRSVAYHFEPLAKTHEIWSYKDPRRCKDGWLQHRVGFQQISTVSKAQHRHFGWQGKPCYAKSDVQSIAPEAKGEDEMQVPQFSPSGNSKKDIAACQGSASKTSRTQSSSLPADAALESFLDASGQSADESTTTEPNLKQVGIQTQKQEYFRIRRLQSEVIDRKDYWLQQRKRNAPQARIIQRAHELSERHQLGEPVTIRRYLRRDLPPKKPESNKKTPDGDSSDAGSEEVIARNRVGTPVVRKVLT